jgi:hypothetical protein
VESGHHAGMPVVHSIAFAVERTDRGKVVSSWEEQIDALQQR